MMTWQTKKLGDIADISSSGVDKIIRKGEITVKLCNYIDVYSNGSINHKHNFSLGSVNDKELQNFSLKKGQVIITKDSETPDDIARSAYVEEDLDGVVCGYHLFLITPENRILNGKYLKYYFDHPVNHHYFNKLANGVTRFGLTVESVKKAEIFIPDLAEQERIVGVLGVWDEYLEKLERKIELKEQSKLFLSYSILNQEIIKGAAQKKVKDLCLIRTGKKDVNQGNPNGAYPFFTCSRDYTYSDDFSYDCEAILIAGNADVGHCKYYAGKFEAYQRTYILSDFSKVDAKYMFYVMSLYFKREIESKKQSGAMSYIKLPMLQNFLVSVPELSVQKDIANKLDNINTEIELLKSKKSQIEQQKKFLLKKIVSGELRTPEDILEKGVSR